VDKGPRTQDGPRTRDQAPRTTNSRRLWPCLPLLAGLYLPFLGGGLLTDDFAHVVRLSNIDSPGRLIDAPDAFGFYRPVTQASLALTPGLRGSQPAQGRAFNVVLHACVIALAFTVAWLVLPSPFAAGLATLAFALTPKATAIAALWISARGELLMALFSLASIAAWIMWTRRGRTWWLAAAVSAYGLALLSKETATLLPLLLLLTPRPERPFAVRASAIAGFGVIALVIYVWRSQVGALTPFAGDEHYHLVISLTLWLRNSINYAGRMIAAPLALLVLLGVARLMDKRRPMPLGSYSIFIPLDVIAFAAAFVVVFLTPVLPIALRSELYLYLPVFGVCLFAGWLGSLLFYGIQPRSVAAAVAVYILALGAYQIARARDIHQDLLFSDKLVAALRSDSQLVIANGSVLLIPSDRTMERSLQSAIGGYFSVVLQHAFDGGPRAGAVQYSGEPTAHAGLRLLYAARQSDGAVVISSTP